MTNGDKIRSMSDEELSVWLDDWNFCADECPESINEVEESAGYLPALEMAIDALINYRRQDRCKIYARVPVECKEYLKDVAEKAGIPISEYLTRLILKDIGKKHDKR